MALDLGKVTMTADYDLRLMPRDGQQSGLSLGTVSVNGTLDDIRAFADEIAKSIARELDRMQARSIRRR